MLNARSAHGAGDEEEGPVLQLTYEVLLEDFGCNKGLSCLQEVACRLQPKIYSRQLHQLKKQYGWYTQDPHFSHHTVAGSLKERHAWILMLSRHALR